MKNIPRVEIHSRQEFQYLFQQHTPVIITNFQSTWYPMTKVTNQQQPGQQQEQQQQREEEKMMKK